MVNRRAARLRLICVARQFRSVRPVHCYVLKFIFAHSRRARGRRRPFSDREHARACIRPQFIRGIMKGFRYVSCVDVVFFSVRKHTKYLRSNETCTRNTRRKTPSVCLHSGKCIFAVLKMFHYYCSARMHYNMC